MRSRINRPISPAASLRPARSAHAVQPLPKPKPWPPPAFRACLVTSPLATPDMQARLGALLLRRANIMVVADNPRNVAELADTAARSAAILDVMVELDVGIGRTGCVEVADAIELARQIAGSPSLRFAGVQAYWGHIQQVMPFETREARVKEEAVRLKALIAGLTEIGLKPGIVSGGGTGTHWIDSASRPLHRIAGRLLHLSRFLLWRGALDRRWQSLFAVALRGGRRRHRQSSRPRHRQCRLQGARHRFRQGRADARHRARRHLSLHGR